MVLGRIVLFLVGIAFGLYGLMCLLDPQAVANYSGLELPNASARVEVVAMYGGLQFGLGVLFTLGAFRTSFFRTGLFVLIVTLGCLALGRAFGLWVYGASAYNVSALVFESISAGLAVLALRLHTRNLKVSNAV